MPVAPSLLAHLTNVSSLTGLIQALGITPETTWLPPAQLPLPVTEAALLGRRGSFEWLGVSGDGCAAQAQRLAGRLAAQGRICGVIAIDPVARMLGIAVSLDRSAGIEIKLTAPGRSQLESLARLGRIEATSGVEYALRAIDALDGEDIGRRFFAAFRDQLERMAESIHGVSPEDRRAIALIHLTRVLFLYFVQVKGWLDGKPDFLRQAVDDALARRKHLHRDLLRPLFFGTLNCPIDARGVARRFGRIPFLNGGLFEPHPLERSWRKEIPTPVWRDAFDTLFERFHFCVSEEDAAGAIAPDMLGRVFEGVMAPEARRNSGTFYTPVRLVRGLVDSTLAAWASTRLLCSLEDARIRLDSGDRQLVALLHRITILDPAAGSGAFLLGALQRLAELRQDELPPAQLRRRILEQNLFGVDINPMAVRLAELRLWLAVIATESESEPERVTPLPNLDGVIRQGDSLLDPAWFLGSIVSRPDAAGERVGELRRHFVLASGIDKREAHRRLRQAELQALLETLRDGRERTEAEIVTLLGPIREPTLFGERRPMRAQERMKLRALRSRLTGIRRIERQVRKEGMLPWFLYQSQFADVLARGGFDLIVGNPPWVRAEQVPSGTRARLEQRYRWWRGSGSGYAHLPDLSVAFVERSFELLAPDGALGLLLPAKIATAGYGQRLRAALVESHTVQIIADLRDDPAAIFEATTYPAALVASRAAPPRTHAVRLALDPGDRERIPQARLLGGKPWVLASPALLEAIVALREAHPLVGERFTPQSGVKTGANAVFLNPPETIEPALVRRAIRGRDISPFTAAVRARLLFAHDSMGVVFPRLPPHALAHIRAHEGVLRVRTDYSGGPLWSLFRVRPALAPHRVVWSDIARRLTATALTGAALTDLIPLNSCYLLAAPNGATAQALAAWLNSSWCRAIARATADPASSGFARFTARTVAELPLPRSVADDERLAAIARRGANGELIQEELDDICAEHLGLTPALRALLHAAPGVDPDHRGRSTRRGR
jgi:SAM-dependent methyltransferase